MEKTFISVIHRCRRRLWLGRFTGAMADALAFALLAFVAFGTVAEDLGWGQSAWVLFGLGLGLCSLAYLVWQTLQGLSLKTVAIRLDRELGFADRISSALAFLSDAKRDSFRQAHIEEAARFLQDKTDCHLAIPWPKRGRAFVLFIVISLGAVFPHSDRLQLEAISQRHEKARKIRATRSLVSELEDLRRQAKMHGLKDLADVLAAAERALEEEMRILTEEDLRPPPEPESPEADRAGRTSQEKASDDASRVASGAEAQGNTSQGPRLSTTASYKPMGKFDSFPDMAYRQTFQKIDKVIVDPNMTAEQMQDMVKHLGSTASQVASYGQEFEGDVMGSEGQARGPHGEGVSEDDDHKNFERAGLGLHMKAFGEFLNRYASHLGEKAMGQAKLEMSQQKNEGGEQFNISGTPPKDAKFAVKGVSDKPGESPLMQGSKEQMAKVAAQASGGKGTATANSSNAQAVRGKGTSLGGKGAGAGGAGQRSAPVAILPRADGGEYLPLEGKLGDGEAVLQIIDARGRRNISSSKAGSDVSYHDVFVEYAKGAEAELNGERVPLQMRDYIRAYFRSIRPQAADAKAKEPQESKEGKKSQ